MESTLGHAIYSSKAHNEELLSSLNEYLNVGVENDKELNIEEVYGTSKEDVRLIKKYD